MSANDWYHGGPTRHWMRAVSFRSTHDASIPATAVAAKPGKIR